MPNETPHSIPVAEETDPAVTNDIDDADSANPETDTALVKADTVPSEPSQISTDTENACYEVNVTQYAQYENHDEVYTQETKESLSYASRPPFVRFFLDFAAILAHPTAFWRGQDLHPATIGQLLWPHLTILILLRTAAVFVGGFLQPDSVLSQVVIQAVTQGVLIFLLVWAMSLIIAGISALSGSGFHYTKALRFVGYGITPMLFVGLIGAIPLPWLANICDLLAMPWAFIVMGTGILPYLKLKPDHAPTLAALICGVLLCLWGAMPMLIPFLLGLKLW